MIVPTYKNLNNYHKFIILGQKKVAEIVCNVLENSKNKYEDPPSSHIPVIVIIVNKKSNNCYF